MKLSLSWIFDHIDSPMSRYDITDIVQRFNKTTAEIEAVHEVHFDKQSFAVAKVTSIANDGVTVHCAEWGSTFTLPLRTDAREGLLFIIVRHHKGHRWATSADWHSTKEGLLPTVHVSAQETNGGWKDHIAPVDYILEVDNKSITHRADLWGHRGFAREIAAMFKVACKNENALYEPLKVVHETSKSNTHDAHACSLEIKDHKKIKALAGVHIQHVKYQASVPWMMYRLCLVDARAINTLVDATNYTMYDIGQPLHAFDADIIAGNKLIARTAHDHETLTTLDGEQISLNKEDIVIADAKKVLSLAGIMGGKDSGISDATHSIIAEAACFDASTIRHSVLRHKKRTDAAARFEKTLDPHQVIKALCRYVSLLRTCGVAYTHVSSVIAVGEYSQPHHITVFHSFLQHRLGITLAPETVEQCLSALDFKVAHKDHGHDREYIITVPSFRSLKDIRIKEDIVEEVGRAVGYDTFTPTPCVKAAISDMQVLHTRRLIKELCSNALNLQEVYTYALFDEHFLAHIGWQPTQSIKVIMPVSENRQQLVTTLIPQLLSVIAKNAPEHDVLRFFEYARIWHYDGSTPSEKKSLAGVVYDKHNKITFYDGKALLETLFVSLRLAVSWHKVDAPKDPWFIPYQTAELRHNNHYIGYAGLTHPLFFEKIAPGAAFMFELDADFLINYVPDVVRMVPASKFPDVVKDLSILVPLSMTVAELQKMIKAVDTRIFAVEVQDFFEKAEWQDQRSVTFRYTVRDYEKTMTKYDLDAVHDHIARTLAGHGVHIR